MAIEIQALIGETTTYDKKEMLEAKRPKSWLKSVSAFANGNGGMLIFGISDSDEIKGLENAEQDAEIISERIKTLIDPVPSIDLTFKEINGKKLILLQVQAGQETPYYYIGDKQRLAYIRIGNESVIADRLQLKRLVMKGAGCTYDSMLSPYEFKNLSFTKLRSVHFKRLHRSFEDGEFTSWGIIDDEGNVTNAGALIADESPIRQSRIFCTRWNGLTKSNGLGEAFDDVELEGSVIGQLQDAVSFVRNNSHKKWWKEDDFREELPDYPERAVIESIVNAIIHRDYMELGSEVHLDIYDDRLEVYSPGGMMDGKHIQDLDLLNVPSKRRNPLLADFFNRLDLMERRGSGMRKIIDAYQQYEKLETYKRPVFRSDSDEFHVTLWNLNYGHEHAVKTLDKPNQEFTKEFTKEFTLNKDEFTKEFVKAQREIYRCISKSPNVTREEISKQIGLSVRQIQKYMKRLSDLGMIKREGGRKNGRWIITDEDYEKFFDRI